MEIERALGLYPRLPVVDYARHAVVGVSRVRSRQPTTDLRGAIIGKLHSPDSIVHGTRNPQALNRHAYALNNPLTLVDPSGHRYDDPSGGHDPWDPNWVKQFEAVHSGQAPTQQDWQDYQFSLSHPGSGPNGTWTQENWAAFTDVKDTLRGLLAEIGRPQDAWVGYSAVGALFWPGSILRAPSEEGPDGTTIKFWKTPNGTTAVTLGNDITINLSCLPHNMNSHVFRWGSTEPALRALMAHEYTHVLQYRALGASYLDAYRREGGFYNWQGNTLEIPAVHIQDIYSNPNNAWLPPPWDFGGVAP